MASQRLNTVSNHKLPFKLSDSASKDMQGRRDALFAASKRREERWRQTQKTKAELAIREKMIRASMSAAGVNISEYENLVAERRRNVERLVPLPMDRPRPFGPPPGPPPPPKNGALGQMWWIKSSSWTTGNVTEMEPPLSQEDGQHFVYQSKADSGDLKKGNFTYLMQFGLGPDRMPAGGGTRFFSVPLVRMNGPIKGHTGTDLLELDDFWAKCWLHVTQNVYVGSTLVASQTDTRTLMFLESYLDYQTTRLPGFVLAPRADFILDRSQFLGIDVIFSFDTQVEGDGSDIHLGEPRGDQEYLADGVVLDTPQWQLQS